MVDAEHTPIDFKVLDARHVDLCARDRRCGVCGSKIRAGRVAFIGPGQQLEAGCFGDPWMHPDCAELAAVQCPFVAARRTWRDVDARADPALARYAQMAIFTAAAARSHRDPAGQWHFQAIGELARVA